MHEYSSYEIYYRTPLWQTLLCWAGLILMGTILVPPAYWVFAHVVPYATAMAHYARDVYLAWAHLWGMQ